MKCPYCDQEIPDGSSVCPVCMKELIPVQGESSRDGSEDPKRGDDGGEVRKTIRGGRNAGQSSGRQEGGKTAQAGK